MMTPIKEIDAATLKGWLDRGECTLIDVREPGEHARAHIPGAVLIPLRQIEPTPIAAGARGTIVLHCASGARSAQVARRFSESGIEVVQLAGGLAAWRNAGLPVSVNPKAPLPIMRQVQLIAGSLVVAGTALGIFVHPGFLALPAAVGAGLAFAGATGHCGMATVLARLPYNRV